MSTLSAARRDAFRNFIPNEEPQGHQRYGSYYKACYDEEWRKLQNEHEAEQRIIESRIPTIEERVEALEEQVRQLLEERQQ